jgi:hypothetical protein
VTVRLVVRVVPMTDRKFDTSMVSVEIISLVRIRSDVVQSVQIEEVEFARKLDEVDTEGTWR